MRACSIPESVACEWEARTALLPAPAPRTANCRADLCAARAVRTLICQYAVILILSLEGRLREALEGARAEIGRLEAQLAGLPPGVKQRTKEMEEKETVL